MVDYSIWPWFERLEFLKQAIEYEFDESKFPKLSAWIKKMKKEPAVVETATNLNDLVEFHKSFTAGHPDYDIGL